MSERLCNISPPWKPSLKGNFIADLGPILRVFSGRTYGGASGALSDQLGNYAILIVKKPTPPSILWSFKIWLDKYLHRMFIYKIIEQILSNFPDGQLRSHSTIFSLKSRDRSEYECLHRQYFHFRRSTDHSRTCICDRQQQWHMDSSSPSGSRVAAFTLHPATWRTNRQI